MIQAHRIRRNESSRWPRRFVWLDTETKHSLQRNGHRVQTWRLGVTAYDGWDEYRKQAKPLIFKRHETPLDLWRYVYDIHVPRSRTVLVAHNLGFDLRASNAFGLLPQWGWKLIKIGVHGKNITVTWRLKNGATLVCVDSHSWLPTSLAKVGDMLGTPKPPDPEQDDDEAWWLRCIADVTIMREAMREVWTLLAEQDFGTFQRTGAGMAWSNWRHKHYSHEVFVHDRVEARDAEVAATYTGRCEAWRHGTYDEGPYDEWDLSLAYARCAAETLVPVSLYGHQYQPDTACLTETPRARRTLMRAEVTTDVPVLPARTKDGILWPTGTFVGWWWDDELRLAVEAGALVNPSEAWIYTAKPALAAWAGWIIDAIENPANGYTEVQRAVFKHWSRALIGKFGAKYDNWAPLGRNPTGEVCLVPCIDREGGELSNILFLGDQALISTVEAYGDDACPFVQGAIMAACRVKLWRVMRKVRLDSVYYVDTDSVITDSKGSNRLHRDRTTTSRWGLRLKSKVDSVQIHGPRQIVFGDERRFAGIPRAAVPRGDGTYYGEVWESAEAALRRGRTSTVVTVPAVWHPNPIDRRREHLAGGETRAMVVG